MSSDRISEAIRLLRRLPKIGDKIEEKLTPTGWARDIAKGLRTELLRAIEILEGKTTTSTPKPKGPTCHQDAYRVFDWVRKNLPAHAYNYKEIYRAAIQEQAKRRSPIPRV